MIFFCILYFELEKEDDNIHSLTYQPSQGKGDCVEGEADVIDSDFANKTEYEEFKAVMTAMELDPRFKQMPPNHRDKCIREFLSAARALPNVSDGKT